MQECEQQGAVARGGLAGRVGRIDERSRLVRRQEDNRLVATADAADLANQLRVCRISLDDFERFEPAEEAADSGEAAGDVARA